MGTVMCPGSMVSKKGLSLIKEVRITLPQWTKEFFPEDDEILKKLIKIKINAITLLAYNK